MVISIPFVSFLNDCISQGSVGTQQSATFYGDSVYTSCLKNVTTYFFLLWVCEVLTNFNNIW